jgi:hypothetical protein
MREASLVVVTVSGLAAIGCAGVSSAPPKAATTAVADEWVRVVVSGVSHDPEVEALTWGPAELSRAGEKILRAWQSDGDKRLTAAITVEFRIDSRGSALGTSIVRSSGIADLDLRAQKAVFAAGPFEKPISRWTICEKCSWTLTAAFDPLPRSGGHPASKPWLCQA